MMLLRKPSDEEIRAYLARQTTEEFSYSQIGCTEAAGATKWPGWNRDQERVLLGRGAAVFESGKQAIRQWRMFPGEVAKLCWPDCPLTVGAAVVVLYRTYPPLLWMLFPARIVYTLHETVQRSDEAVERFGFAYGTVADHPEQGEERFLVEWNRTTDEVHYDLLAISRPVHWLARLGYAYTRYEQGRFRRLSCAAMQRAVTSEALSVDPQTAICSSEGVGLATVDEG